MDKMSQKFEERLGVLSNYTEYDWYFEKLGMWTMAWNDCKEEFARLLKTQLAYLDDNTKADIYATIDLVEELL